MHAAGDDGDLEPVPDHGLAPERSEPDERLFIASLEKGLRVLEAFSDATTELGLQDIAMATGLGKSAVQRLVYTLFQLDYLRRDPTTRKYRLSPKAFVRGYVLASTSKLAQEAHASLVVVNNKCGDTCALTILEGAEIVILSSILGRHINSLNVTVGMRFPPIRSPRGVCSPPGCRGRKPGWCWASGWNRWRTTLPRSAGKASTSPRTRTCPAISRFPRRYSMRAGMPSRP